MAEKCDLLSLKGEEMEDGFLETHKNNTGIALACALLVTLLLLAAVLVIQVNRQGLTKDFGQKFLGTKVEVVSNSLPYEMQFEGKQIEVGPTLNVSVGGVLWVSTDKPVESLRLSQPWLNDLKLKEFSLYPVHLNVWDIKTAAP